MAAEGTNTQKELNPLANAERQFDEAGVQAQPARRACGRSSSARAGRPSYRCRCQMDDGIAPRLHRLSRPALDRARSRQGRHPLPPGRHARGGRGAGGVDDLEVRGGEHSRSAAARAGSSAIRRKMSKGELERLTRRYAADLSDLFGPESDVPAPDVNTNEQVDGVDHGHLLRCTSGAPSTAVVTGKPLEVGRLGRATRGHRPRRAVLRARGLHAISSCRSRAPAWRCRASATSARSRPT